MEHKAFEALLVIIVPISEDIQQCIEYHQTAVSLIIYLVRKLCTCYKKIRNNYNKNLFLSIIQFTGDLGIKQSSW